MDSQELRNTVEAGRKFFASGRTRDVSFRLEQLRVLKKSIIQNERRIFDALKKDLHKPEFESYGGDVAIVVREIDHAIKHLRSWAKPRRFPTPAAYFPGTSRVMPEPYGLALIIAPWNFPFQLSLAPLVGSIAAGNCTVLKPPVATPHSAELIARMMQDRFDPSYIAVVQGGAETGERLLEERFDYIFFTGGVATGRQVMQAAARHLTPVTLELGGKNPCIVDADTHLECTARRIVWGKFFNAGQSCVAVDYLFVQKAIKQELLAAIARVISEFYGRDPAHSRDYARILNDTHFDRLTPFLADGRIIAGGRVDRASRYIAPTVLDGITGKEPIMEEEIFGPILPVLEYDDLSEPIAFANQRPKPLALYFFSRDRAKQKRILNETSSGGCCINDVVIHETSGLPFGGVGESGIGKYHGRTSFDTFSHEKSVVTNGFLFDVFLRYPPYKHHLKWLKKIF